MKARCLGGGPLPATGQDKGDRGVFLAAFDAAGTLLWANGFGQAGVNQLARLSGNGTGAVSATGTFTDAIDFGALSLVDPTPDAQPGPLAFAVHFTVR